MYHHRFVSEAEVTPLPRPPAPALGMDTFVLCPVVVLPGTTAEQILAQQQIYQVALDQALAVARPSLPERDLLAVWN